MGNDGVPDLSVSAPSLDWKQMVDQLNQDPRANSVTDSAQETISMGEERADIAGDEEVECRDDGSTTQVTASPGVTDLDWDPCDPLFEFNDENSGTTHTPVAALMPVAAEEEDGMPELEDASPGEPPQMDPPQSSGTGISLETFPEGPVPDYANVPLSRFCHPELHQVIPWIRFEGQNMCEPPWHTELALIRQDEIVQYVAAMFTWFHRWWLARGSWPCYPWGRWSWVGRWRKKSICISTEPSGVTCWQWVKCRH